MKAESVRLTMAISTFARLVHAERYEEAIGHLNREGQVDPATPMRMAGALVEGMARLVGCSGAELVDQITPAPSPAVDAAMREFGAVVDAQDFDGLCDWWIACDPEVAIEMLFDLATVMVGLYESMSGSSVTDLCSDPDCLIHHRIN